MDHNDIVALSKGFAPIVEQYAADAVKAATEPLLARLEEIETRPPLKGDQGERGEAGADGTVDPVEMAVLVIGEVEKVAAPLIEKIAEIEARPLVAGPPGENGKDGLAGQDGKDGAPGERGPDGVAGRDGVDGKDADPEETARMVVAEVQRAASEYLSCAPDEIAVDVAKAISLISESPQVTHKTPPIIVNFAAPDKRKTITTRKDKDGNLVADVVEHN